MFDQMKNMRQLAEMFGNPEEIKQKMAELQEELARKTVEADAGAGAVRVTANGRFEITRVELEPAMVASLTGEGDQTDREMVEELIRSATNSALEKAQQMAREELGKATGGMNMPGLENLM